MRHVLAILTAVVMLAVDSPRSIAQQPLAPEQPDLYELRFVRYALRDPKLTLGFSETEKQINRLGDRLAVALLKIYSSEEIAEPSNVKKYLPLLRAAFIAPRIVPDQSDRNPAVTMLLLRSLETRTTNEEERRSISEAIRYIRTQTASQAGPTNESRHN